MDCVKVQEKKKKAVVFLVPVLEKNLKLGSFTL